MHLSTRLRATAAHPMRWRSLGRLGALIAGAALAVGFAPAALASGPGPIWVTYWQGDGTPTSADLDGADGVWSGTPAYTPFPGGSDGDDQGFSFDGSNHVAGPPALGNFGTDDFLINFVMTTETVDGAQHDLMSTRTTTCGGAPFWQVFVGGDGVLSLTFLGPGGATDLTHPTTVNDGQPHDIDILRQGSTLILRVDGTQVSAPIVGTGDFTTVDQHLRLGGGNPCLGVSNLEPFTGAVDYLYVEQGNDPDGQDLLLEQESIPQVPAGGDGSLVVHRLNNSESNVDSAEATFTAPEGVVFTSVSDFNRTCSLVDATTITCPPTNYGATGNNALTIGFTVLPSVAPGSTLNVLGDFTNLSNTDPDHSNDQNVPLAIQVVEETPIPLVKPVIAIPLAGAFLVGVVLVRRRTRIAAA